MKKAIPAILLMISLPFNSAQSSGIPTIDIAGIIQGLQESLVRVQEFKEQIKEAKGRLQQLKDTGEHYKEMVDGHFDFEAILNDPLLNEHLALDDWKDIYDDVSDLANLRDEFGMISDDPIIQAKWDKQLQSYSAQQKFYDLSAERNENLTNLLDQFTTATNPAAKADLANSIQFENAQIENDKAMMQTMTELMKAEQVLADEKRAMDRRLKFRGDGLEIDYSSAYEGI
jgi:type IV secretion system protein VirB5